MEPSQYFSIGVLTICVIHLAATAWEGINAWWNEIVQRKNLAGGLAMKSTRRADAAPETPVQQRSDWYAFFHCSDLVGPEAPPKNAYCRQTGQNRPTCRKTTPLQAGPRARPAGPGSG